MKIIKAGEHKKLQNRPALDLRNIFQQAHKKIREFTQACIVISIKEWWYYIYY